MKSNFRSIEDASNKFVVAWLAGVGAWSRRRELSIIQGMDTRAKRSSAFFMGAVSVPSICTMTAFSVAHRFDFEKFPVFLFSHHSRDLRRSN